MMMWNYLSNFFSLIFLVIIFIAESAANELTDDKVMGFAVTKGAAAGYIEDKACQQCHPNHWETYQDVGMSHSFSEVKAQNFIENFDLPPYFHEPSQRYYQITKNNDDLMFKRYQLDDEGQPINVFKQQIDWILGSGNRTRSYLYQTDMGEMFQLPLGWYSQSQQWLMGPGFEDKHHFGVERSVRRECLFCHNAFPEVAKGSDQRWEPHIFPDQLPHGTGCQRCHGPGAEHVNTVVSGGTLENIRAKIINPAKLPAKKRDSVCFQCHLLPAVAVIGIRKFGRDDYSFRPGELISDYMVHVDIDSKEEPKADRFEINHHAYRLRQSECFTKSENNLTCISCHNPHKKVPEEQRVDHYGKVCLSCHEKRHPKLAQSSQVTEQSDCVSCHMPERRTKDVIHVTMTDHKIQKPVDSEEKRLAPIVREDVMIDSIDLLMPDDSIKGFVGEVYKIIALLRAVTSKDMTDYLEKLLSDKKNIPPMVYLELASFQIKLGRFEQAQNSLNFVLSSDPQNSQALNFQGTLFNSQGKTSEAIELYKKALVLNPNKVEVYVNLGLSYFRHESIKEAEENFFKAVSLRPNMKISWYYLGEIAVINNNPKKAIDHYKKALSIDPSFDRAYVKLAEVLVTENDVDEAKRYLRHGVKVVVDNSSLVKALNKLDQKITESTPFKD